MSWLVPLVLGSLGVLSFLSANSTRERPRNFHRGERQENLTVHCSHHSKMFNAFVTSHPFRLLQASSS